MDSLQLPVDSPPRPLSIMTTATSASQHDKSGVAWAKGVNEENAWEDLILTLGTYIRLRHALGFEWCQHSSDLAGPPGRSSATTLRVHGSGKDWRVQLNTMESNVRNSVQLASRL